MGRSRWSSTGLFGLLAAAVCMTGSTPATVGAEVHFGYMVEIHTCDIPDAGTNATIQMALDVTDEDGMRDRFGPWTQDLDDRYVDDHERGEWDAYFFAESTAIDFIDDLTLTSDGDGNKPGWCWDRMYITRIYEDRAVRTWEYSGDSGWMYAGTRRFGPAYELGQPRPIPADLYTRGQGPPASSRRSAVVVTLRGYGYEDIHECGSVNLRVSTSTAGLQQVRGMLTLDDGWRCIYSRRFEPVSEGWAQVQAVDQWGRILACTDIYVSAGGQVPVTLTTGGYFCR